ncbi:hypothetical protein JZ751_018434 [Albula glossodonta]|uniref:Uncharacterized protein n=1 Tax=Albula glossodonta TaxID=121402 RepID=A0A8T2MZZ9_9TELE|nr:hypothetical protein JZ751_018434 [Albula glossodonta]
MASQLDTLQTRLTEVSHAATVVWLSPRERERESMVGRDGEEGQVGRERLNCFRYGLRGVDWLSGGSERDIFGPPPQGGRLRLLMQLRATTLHSDHPTSPQQNQHPLAVRSLALRKQRATDSHSLNRAPTERDMQQIAPGPGPPGAVMLPVILTSCAVKGDHHDQTDHLGNADQNALGMRDRSPDDHHFAQKQGTPLCSFCPSPDFGNWNLRT